MIALGRDALPTSSATSSKWKRVTRVEVQRSRTWCYRPLCLQDPSSNKIPVTQLLSFLSLSLSLTVTVKRKGSEQTPRQCREQVALVTGARIPSSIKIPTCLCWGLGVSCVTLLNKSSLSLSLSWPSDPIRSRLRLPVGCV